MGPAWRGCLLAAGLCAVAPAGATEPASITILMQKQSFVPATVKVAAGTRITWINRDDMPHSVTAADNRFDSGAVPPGKSFEWIVSGDGPVDYRCIFHPSMTAVLTIAGAAPRAATTRSNDRGDTTMSNNR